MNVSLEGSCILRDSVAKHTLLPGWTMLCLTLRSEATLLLLQHFREQCSSDVRRIHNLDGNAE